MSTINSSKLQILKQSGKTKKKDVYYLPGYLRLKHKNFTQMDLQNLNAGMNATLIFTVYYGNLDEQIVQQLQSKIIFNFNRDDARQLTKDDDLEVTVKNDTDKRQIQFSIRQVFELRIQSEVFFTPFEMINLILSITVQPVVMQNWGTFKINLMDHTLNKDISRLIKTSYSEQGAFGTYDLAELKMASLFTNNRACKVEDFYRSQQEKIKLYQEKLKEDDDNGQKKDLNKKNKDKIKITQNSKVQHFQYAHFLIPLYRYPLDSLATIFLPLWLLAVINLAIFFQDTSMGNRVGSISAIMIAFVALIPTIRENIPPNPRIVFIEILVYLNSLTSLFVLIDSISVRNLGSDYEFQWNESGLFLVSVLITIISVLLIIAMMIAHYAYWIRTYKAKGKEDLGKFDKQQWGNVLCDMYFKKVNQKRSKNLIQVFQEGTLPPIKSKKLT